MQRARWTGNTRKTVALMSLAGFLAPGCLVDDRFEPPSKITQEIGKDIPEHDETSILIKFRDTPTVASMGEVLAKVDGKILDVNRDGKHDHFAHVAGGRLAKIDLAGSVKALEAIDKLKGHPTIEYAELNYILYPTLIPNDPAFGSLYGLHNTGQNGGTPGADISAVEAWETTTGSHEVIVGVIDTGIDYNHPDLAANMWVNPGEIPGNGIDDDGNGYIDDVYGINAITGTGNPMDDHNHGTHVAGTIGAVGDNAAGVVGVNWNVSMVALKFLSAAGSGTTAGAIACINYAVDLKNNRGVDIRVLSNSWGGGGFSQALFDAIAAANEADILFVAAAGNSAANTDNVPHYPSSYDVPNVVSVASTTRTDTLSSFSNFGASSVHLGAPGSDILSTTRNNTYSTFSGTSMATPHVSGVAALLLAVNNTLSTGEIKDILVSSGDPLASLAGKTISGKRLNAASALSQVSPPGPNFRLAAGPASQTINQGESASYTVDVTSVAGFADDVTLSLSTSPALDGAVTFTPNPVAPDSTATLTIDTSENLAVGTYNLTIAATSGDITKSRAVSLTVRPAGTVSKTYTNNTQVSIPDNTPAGITSTLLVTDQLIISEVAATVNITHTYIGDLIVRLTSPAGTTVTLHNRSGGSADNINQTYVLPDQFLGQNSGGLWTLFVSDNAGIDVGTLDNWSLEITGAPTGLPPLNIPPNADFSFDANALTVSFTDGSSDEDGIVTAWSWDFGDGNTSTAQNPTHTYAETGLYTVTLTVTDNDGGTSSASQSIKVLAPGTVIRTYTNDTRVSIPDNTPAGITSTIDVPDSLVIFELAVTVNITHTYIGDLIVRLTSPSGTTVTLHNRTGGSADNIYRTYEPVQFEGEDAVGTWTLFVSDNARIDIGTLDNWSLTVTGTPPIDLFVEPAIRLPNGKSLAVLYWEGANTDNVEIYRNGELVAITANDGEYPDRFLSSDSSVAYKVCEEDGTACSGEVIVDLQQPGGH